MRSMMETDMDKVDEPKTPTRIKQELNNEECDDKNVLNFSSRSPLNFSTTAATSSSSCRVRVGALRNDLHDKGSLLANTWNELYTLLGEYQAELYGSEEDILQSKDRYEDVTNIDQLRNELVEKDNIIRELEEKLASAESQIDSVRLDLSVKNSLLNKYQQELLEKEASLMANQAAKHKLENKARVLEARLSSRSSLDNNSGISSHHHGLVSGRVNSGLLNTRISSMALKRRGPTSSILQGSSKRKLTAPEQLSRPQSQVVCIDDDDENESMSEGATGHASSDSLYMDAWQDAKCETETTSQDSLPGHSYTDHQHLDIDTSHYSGGGNATGGLATFAAGSSVPIDGTIPEAALQGWELQASTSGADVLQQSMMMGGQLLVGGDDEKSPSQKNSSTRFACHLCFKTYRHRTHLVRHNTTVHLGVRRHVCHVCDKRFGRKESLSAHLRHIHNTAPDLGAGRRLHELDMGFCEDGVVGDPTT